MASETPRRATHRSSNPDLRPGGELPNASSSHWPRSAAAASATPGLMSPASAPSLRDHEAGALASGATTSNACCPPGAARRAKSLRRSSILRSPAPGKGSVCQRPWLVRRPNPTGSAPSTTSARSRQPSKRRMAVPRSVFKATAEGLPASGRSTSDSAPMRCRFPAAPQTPRESSCTSAFRLPAKWLSASAARGELSPSRISSPITATAQELPLSTFRSSLVWTAPAKPMPTGQPWMLFFAR
mmetsp:Transcript_19385/g.42339  ORF Transcript_19385/g.42339 Transcript_19385/m.42339 type:complete len:242 (-) Transcript_19385:428-1153(-)